MSTATTTATVTEYAFVGDGDNTAPVLYAESVEAARWNGWSSPIVTAAQLAAWVEQTMPETHVHEAGGELFIADPIDPENWHDYFPQVGVTSDGAALYTLCGWCFLPYTAPEPDDDDEPEVEPVAIIQTSGTPMLPATDRAPYRVSGDDGTVTLNLTAAEAARYATFDGITVQAV